MNPPFRSLPALISLAAIAAFIAPAPAAARDKPEPAPQWAVDAAKTPTPANIKDAPAVILFDEYLITIDNDNHAVERERKAVRILKPQGRQYGTCYAAYDIDEKLNYFRSWTIDSTGRQFQAMESDFTDFGAYDEPVLQMTERVRVVKPPASDPGAVVACEIEERLQPYMSEEIWNLQKEIPVVSQSLELDLPPGGHFATSWHRTPALQPTELASNHLRWEMKDTPALDLENLHATPDWRALAARASIHWGDSAVKGVDAQWRAIGQWMTTLEEHRPDPSPEITAKAQELTAGAPDLYTKLSRITDYVQKNVRYFIVIRGIGGWQAHYASDIYRNKYGDCKDKTTLLISMLQAVGIHAHYFAVDVERGFVDPAAPSRFSDHMITAIELPDGENDPHLLARVKAGNGKTLLIFDPTDQLTPVGLIRSDLQGGWGFIAGGTDSQVLQMPVMPPNVSGLTRKGSFTLTADGALAGDVHEIFTGDDATYERSFLKKNDSKEIHEKLENGLGADLPGLAFKGFEFSGATDLDKPLDLDLHLGATGYAHHAGTLLLLRPRVLGTHVRAVPDVMEGKPRAYSIEIGHPGRWHDSFDIAIPPGYVVDETPDPVNIDLDFASYHSSISAKDNTLHYDREYTVRQVEIPPARAQSFRMLESAIMSDEKGTAVLKKQ
jgi:transglutaminase-like putative cysteine protease